MLIRELKREDLKSLKEATDAFIGEGYFTLPELEESLKKATKSGICCSFVLVDPQGKIQGFRIAYPPGQWSKGRGSQLRDDLWEIKLEEAGYFQSLFLAPEIRGGGWGPKLSETAAKALKKLGTKAIVTHAWKESPNDSSIRYLTKSGFEKVTEHPEYWVNVDYTCVLDGKPCRCTAIEMIKYL